MNQSVHDIWRKTSRGEAPTLEKVPQIVHENARQCGRVPTGSNNGNWLSWLAE
jgi:hypothetical protein